MNTVRTGADATSEIFLSSLYRKALRSIGNISVVHMLDSDGAVAARTWPLPGGAGGRGAARNQRELKSQPDSQAARRSR